MQQSRSFCFLFGISIGAAVGLLYAPRRGTRTRAMIASKAEQGQRFILRQSEELRDKVVDQVERGKEVLTQAAESVKATVEAGRKAFGD
jgi:gas vesicle protein